MKFNFFCVSDSRKTKIFEITSVSSGIPLGYIKWYGKWRQYTFYPEPKTIFNKECLKDIEDYLTDINKEHKRLNRDKKSKLSV